MWMERITNITLYYLKMLPTFLMKRKKFFLNVKEKYF